MKKCVFVLAVVCVLSACTGFVDSMNAAAELTTDVKYGDMDSYVRTHGAPTSSYKMQNGDTVYSFVKPCASAAETEEVVVTVRESGWIRSIFNKRTCPIK